MPRYLMLFVVMACACATTQLPPPAPPSAGTGDLQHTTKATAKYDDDKSQQELLALIPADALAAAVFHRGAIKQLVDQWLIQSDEMYTALQKFLNRSLGDDLLSVESIALFATQVLPTPAFAAILRRIPKSKPAPLKGKVVGRYKNIVLIRVGPPSEELVAAQLENSVVIGHKSAVQRAIKVSLGKSKPLSPKDALGDLFTFAKPDVVAQIGLRFDALPIPIPFFQGNGPRSATLSVTDAWNVTLRISGDEQSLTMIRGGLTMVLTGLLSRQKSQMEQATQGDDILTGIGNIVAYYRLRDLIKAAEPTIENGRLVSHLLVSQGHPHQAISAAAVGILAAIAIPEFTKYKRRAATHELRGNIEIIKERLIRHVGQVSPKKRRRFRFLRSTPWDPKENFCNNGGRVDTLDHTEFSHPTWKALNFAPSTGHRFQYRIVSKGRGNSASVLVEARGDADCDGVFAEYKAVGLLDADGHLVFAETAISNEGE